MVGTIILAIVIVVVLVVLFILAVRIVRPFQQGVVERLGKYRKTSDPGFHLIIPFVDRMTRVDMRENVVEVPPQDVITKDNVEVTVDAVIYYIPTDAVKLIYNITNFYLAATKLAQTNLRNVIGEMTLDETLTSRELINTKLRDILYSATEDWGVRIQRVELQRIEPPADVTESMHRQMKAERERRATILEAEGVKQSQILRSEGVKQSQILEAEGQATAIREIASAQKEQSILKSEGESKAIENVLSSLHEEEPADDLLTLRYIESLQQIADGQATKIFMPLQMEGMASNVGAVSELFKSGLEEPGGNKPMPNERRPRPTTPDEAIAEHVRKDDSYLHGHIVETEQPEDEEESEDEEQKDNLDTHSTSSKASAEDEDGKTSRESARESRRERRRARERERDDARWNREHNAQQQSSDQSGQGGQGGQGGGNNTAQTVMQGVNAASNLINSVSRAVGGGRR